MATCLKNSNFCSTFAKPKTPANISKASPSAHIKQTAKTCSFFILCFKTNAFCAPIANIKDKLVKNPLQNADIFILFKLPII